MDIPVTANNSARDESSAPLPFDQRALADYLAKHVPRDWSSLRLQPFVGGQSNPTYLLQAGDDRYVLRKQPGGQLLPSAHAIDREYKVMQALRGTNVPVPPMIHYAEDRDVIGTPFYVMGYVPGRIFKDPLLPDLSVAERSQVHDSMNLTLARLHSVDPSAHRLADFGKPGNYFGRQIDRWTRQYRETETTEIRAMNELMRRLPAMVPLDTRSSIAHGDFRIENLLYHPERLEVVAVLDWELSTLGHPLADLAYNCFGYHLPRTAFHGFAGVDLAGTGVPTEEEYIGRYFERAGFVPPAPWRFYIAFALFRLAAILQGVLVRAVRGNASSPDAIVRGQLAGLCAEAGLAALERASSVV
jgi:aminoglycoside phosphotransferase (APT) family kinase protein